MTITVHDAIARTGVDVLDYLDRQAEVPVLTGAQRQGDVIVLPQRSGPDKGEAVDVGGVAVVRGEAGGNTHALVPDGPCWWRPIAAGAGLLNLGSLIVDPGAVAFLAHPEHGFLAMAPGRYLLRRQREQADVIRRVAD